MSEYMRRKSHKPKPDIQSDSDLVWGAVGIGRKINRTPGQVYHLF
jgi:hypothetical protein